MNETANATNAETVRVFYRLLDAGNPPFHLFAAAFQFHYPKFGIGRGVEEFVELAMGTRTNISRMSHRIDNILTAEGGNVVTVEGATEGADAKGKEWRGGETSGGRFCTVFCFNPEGLIERMHIYLDPDFVGEHNEGFRWPNRKRQEW